MRVAVYSLIEKHTNQKLLRLEKTFSLCRFRNVFVSRENDIRGWFRDRSAFLRAFKYYRKKFLIV
jgi:hypothetical protein